MSHALVGGAPEQRQQQQPPPEGPRGASLKTDGGCQACPAWQRHTHIKRVCVCVCYQEQRGASSWTTFDLPKEDPGRGS